MGASFPCHVCGTAVDATRGRPRVTATGVALVCDASCAPRRAGPTAPTREAPWPTIVALGTAALAIAAIAIRGSAEAAAATAPVPREIPLDAPGDAGAEPSDRDPRAALVVVAPPEAPPAAALARGFANAEVVWYHPLAAPRRLPISGDRRFGSGRGAPGERPTECGRGHCGVDLGERVGEVVHAALPGVVRHVDRDEGGSGGRYVVLEHGAGFRTYYFHLDRVHPLLIPGIEVAAGEPIGSLGRTGIQHSAPHLHFQVARVDVDGGHAFVDPEPMLRRAVLLDEAAPLPSGETPSHDAGDAPEDDALPAWE